MNPEETPITTTPAPTTTPTTPASPGADLLATIQGQLLNQGGIITSQGAEIDERIGSAIEGLKTGNESANKKLQSEFERNAGYLGDKFTEDQLGGRAAGSGGVMNLAAFKNLVDSTDKSLKDLAMRKEELVLQNNVKAAEKITEMELAAIEYKQKASQQYFSNLLGLGNLTMNITQEQRLAESARTANVEKLGGLITDNPQAGILPTDTYEQALAKITANPNSPDALIKKATLENIQSQIRERNRASGVTVPATVEERQIQALSGFAQYFVPGATYTANDGSKKQTVDSNGFITPEAWQKAISSAPAKGVTRKDFITQFGYLLSPFEEGSKKEGTGYKKYGLTPQEIKLISSE